MAISGGGAPPTVINEAPEAPDMSMYVDASMAAAEMQFALGHEQMQVQREELAWAREQWGEQKALTERVMNVQLPIMEEQHKWAQEDRARYQEVFQPMEDKLVEEAYSYASDERKELESGRAQADVTRAFAAQRQNAQRNLEAYGIDPSQTRSQALGNTLRAQEAASQAGAGNTARLQVDAMKNALRTEAINIGKGYPGNINQAYAGAVNAGNAAVGNMNSSIQASAQARGVGAQYGNIAQNAYASGAGAIGQAADIMNSGYSNKLNAWNAEAGYAMDAWTTKSNQNSEMWGAAIGAAGTAAMFMNEGGAVEAESVRHKGTDAIPAQVNDGEYVVPSDVVRRKGTEFFDKMAIKTREDAGQPGKAPPRNVINAAGQQRKVRAALPAPGGN